MVRAAGGIGPPDLAEVEAEQRADRYMRQGGEPQPHRICAHGVDAGAVGIKVGLAHLDAVLHVAARAERRLLSGGAAERSFASDVTKKKRGLPPILVHAAVVTTRRRHDDRMKSRKTRVAAAPPSSAS